MPFRGARTLDRLIPPKDATSELGIQLNNALGQLQACVDYAYFEVMVKAPASLNILAVKHNPLIHSLFPLHERTLVWNPHWHGALSDDCIGAFAHHSTWAAVPHAKITMALRQNHWTRTYRPLLHATPEGCSTTPCSAHLLL